MSRRVQSDEGMSIPLEAIVGDVHIVGGVRQPVTAPTAVFQPPRRAARGRAGDRLFVLVELRPPDLSAQVEIYNAPYNKIIDQLSAAYWRTEGSVTSALRAAIMAANSWLMDYNLEAPVPERFRAGITCVTMRESDVFIAQAGPAVCYVAHQGALERFPAREVTAPALGASRGVEVRYSHAELHPGDVVLLCDSLTAERLSDETIAQAIVYVGVPAALTNLEKLAGANDLIALVIEGAAVGAPIHAQPAPAPAPPPPPAPQPLPPVVEPELPEPDAIPEIARPTERGPSLRERLSGWWRRVRGRAALTTQTIPRADLTERARQVVRSLVMGVLVVGRSVQSVAQRMMPEQPADSKRSATGSALIGAGLVILIALLVTALAVYLYLQRRQQLEFEAALNLARVQVALAPHASETAEMRTHWQRAWEYASAALNYRPNNAEAMALRNQALDQLDRFDRVMRVRATALFNFGPAAAYRLTAQGAYVFVQSPQKIWRLVLDETGSGVMEISAPTANRAMGELLDLTWVSADGLRTKSSLLILDTLGLLEYDPTWNIRTVPLGQGQARQGLRLVAAFGGNLYILDDTQLWRYRPQGDGFGTTAEAYFDASPGDLSSVIDLAIDGNVYLLYADGRIRRFLGGEEYPFTPTDMPDSLNHPVALAADPDATRGSLYVADAGRARIVQFTSQGIFVRQIKTYDDAMNALQAIFVDERAQRLFFLSDGRLYVATLPPLAMP